MRLLRLGSIVVVTLLLAPASAHAFAVEFVRVRGNNDWVETNVTPVDNDGAVTAVDARINAGSWQNLPRTSWGSYAKGLEVATGSVVEFRARNAVGAVSLSEGYRWSSTPTLIVTSAFAASFTPTTGSLSFIGATVMPNKALARVEARIDSGSWFALTQTGTYSWGQSATTNEQVISARYTWPGGTRGGFVATFSNVHGNAWWLETAISGNQTVRGGHRAKAVVLPGLNTDAQLSQDRLDQVARFPRGRAAQQFDQDPLLLFPIAGGGDALEEPRHFEQGKVAIAGRQQHLERVSEIAHLTALERHHPERLLRRFCGGGAEQGPTHAQGSGVADGQHAPQNEPARDRLLVPREHAEQPREVTDLGLPRASRFRRIECVHQPLHGRTIRLGGAGFRMDPSGGRGPASQE